MHVQIEAPLLWPIGSQPPMYVHLHPMHMHIAEFLTLLENHPLRFLQIHLPFPFRKFIQWQMESFNVILMYIQCIIIIMLIVL